MDDDTPDLLPRIPFQQLIALRQLNEHSFESSVAPWSPDFKTTFGGHALAQAVWAAAQTVKRGFVIHNVQSLFTRRGLPDRAFRYSVETIRDGRAYCTRAVNVRQPDDHGSWAESRVCFTCLCSFKRDEETTFKHQDLVRLEDKYSSVLAGRRPEDHPPAPSIDLPFFWAYEMETQLGDQSPGVDVRKVDMTPYNENRPLLQHRQLQYYTPIGPLVEEDSNLHACIHLYASDRNSLFGIVNGHGFGDRLVGLGTLSHTVIFHAPSHTFTFSDAKTAQWFCEESWSEVSGHGRALRQSKIWDSNGLHVASTFQDGMLRDGNDGDAVGYAKSHLIATRRKTRGAKI